MSKHLVRIVVSIPVLLMAASASAELYRCERPDGSIHFMDNKADCPSAVARVSEKGDIQAVVPAPSTASSYAAARIKKLRERLAAEEKLAKQWKQKKIDAEEELAEVEAEQAEAAESEGWCYRGDHVYRFKDNGLREWLSCDDIRERATELEKRRKEIATYLDSGLREECHREGCLPGWVR